MVTVNARLENLIAVLKKIRSFGLTSCRLVNMDSCLGFEGGYYDLFQGQALSLSVDCLTLKMTAPLSMETSVTY